MRLLGGTAHAVQLLASFLYGNFQLVEGTALWLVENVLHLLGDIPNTLLFESNAIEGTAELFKLLATLFGSGKCLLQHLFGLAELFGSSLETTIYALQADTDSVIKRHHLRGCTTCRLTRLCEIAVNFLNDGGIGLTGQGVAIGFQRIGILLDLVSRSIAGVSTEESKSILTLRYHHLVLQVLNLFEVILILLQTSCRRLRVVNQSLPILVLRFQG